MGFLNFMKIGHILMICSTVWAIAFRIEARRVGNFSQADTSWWPTRAGRKCMISVSVFPFLSYIYVKFVSQRRKSNHRVSYNRIFETHQIFWKTNFQIGTSEPQWCLSTIEIRIFRRNADRLEFSIDFWKTMSDEISWCVELCLELRFMKIFLFKLRWAFSSFFSIIVDTFRYPKPLPATTRTSCARARAARRSLASANATAIGFRYELYPAIISW